MTTKPSTAKINIIGYGRLCPLTEYDQIIWFWEQSLKGSSKAVVTRFWLNMKEGYKNKLIKIQAYELLHHIESKVTDAQEKRRIAYREKTRKLAELEAKLDKRRYDKHQMMKELLKMVTPN